MATIALTILGYATFIDPRLSVLEAFAPHFAVGGVVLSLAVAYRHRVLALAGLIVAGWNAFLVLPTVIVAAPPPVADGPPLKIVSLNLWYENARFAETLDYLKTSGADVIGLTEVTPASKALLADLRTIYLHSVDCVDASVVCNVMLLSRLPIMNGFAGSAGAKLAYVARGDIEWQGRRISIVTAHPMLPFTPIDYAPLVDLLPPGDPSPQLPGAPQLWQSMQMAAIAEYTRTLAPDRVLMGDFNSVAWGRTQTAFRAASGLDNRGHFVPTWMLQLPWIFRLPLDDVFTGGNLVVTRFEAGPDVGSDHAPIEAEVAVTR